MGVSKQNQCVMGIWSTTELFQICAYIEIAYCRVECCRYFSSSPNFSDNERPKSSWKNMDISLFFKDCYYSFGSRPLHLPRFLLFPIFQPSLVFHSSSDSRWNHLAVWLTNSNSTILNGTQNPCNLIRRKGRATNSSKVTEGKGFGQLGSIRQLSAQEMSEAATRPVIKTCDVISAELKDNFLFVSLIFSHEGETVIDRSVLLLIRNLDSDLDPYVAAIWH